MEVHLEWNFHNGLVQEWSRAASVRTRSTSHENKHCAKIIWDRESGKPRLLLVARPELLQATTSCSFHEPNRGGRTYRIQHMSYLHQLQQIQALCILTTGITNGTLMGFAASLARKYSLALSAYTAHITLRCSGTSEVCSGDFVFEITQSFAILSKSNIGPARRSLSVRRMQLSVDQLCRTRRKLQHGQRGAVYVWIVKSASQTWKQTKNYQIWSHSWNAPQKLNGIVLQSTSAGLDFFSRSII